MTQIPVLSTPEAEVPELSFSSLLCVAALHMSVPVSK
jgi:hypothetical protein